MGTGDRSERIRTYNFPQGRVTDHRIGLTLYKLEDILGGSLDEVDRQPGGRRPRRPAGSLASRDKEGLLWKPMLLSDHCPDDIQRAGDILRRGGLVAIPTETVYGLAANALDGEAVKKIYAGQGPPLG